MAVTDIGTSAGFINELRRSGLIERGQLESILEPILSQPTAPDAQHLAQYLVQQGHLTPFQADRILNGKSQGLILGPYVIVDAVGSGSMGAVYRAISRNDRKHYAVKVLPRRSMWNVRLARRQVRAFGQFQHPAVVPFVDVGTSGGLHYLVWDYVEGQSLEAFVQQMGRLNPGTTARIGQQIAVGLNAAHSHGLVHGLIKPSNIMLDRHGNPRLLDFGIGSLLAENENESLVDTMSTANTLTSGLDCASPESIMEPANRTAAGDQYSLGCTLYFCLTGRYPFPEGTAIEKMMAHQTKQPTSLLELAPDVPPPLAAVIERLMQKRPEERFFGADEVAEALAPFATGANRSITSSILNFAVPPGVKSSQSSVSLADTPPHPATGSGTFANLSGETKTNPSLTPGSSAKLSKAQAPTAPPSPPSRPELQLPTRQSLANAGMSSTVLNLGRMASPPVPSPSPTTMTAGHSSAVLSQPVLPTAPAYPLPPGEPIITMPSIGSASRSGSGSAQPASPVNIVQVSPIMGPLGFIALGATVALASYLVVLSLLR